MVRARRRSIVPLIVGLVLLLAAALVWRWRDRAPARSSGAETQTLRGGAAGADVAASRRANASGGDASGRDVADPLPGQGRAVVEAAAGMRGGGFGGRVINWSTGDGIAGAELTFSAAAGEVITVRSDPGGGFELAPREPGAYVLAAVEAAGFLPYAPEWQHSSVRLFARGGERVRGLTVFLFPALDYTALVVDEGAPVAGAKARLLGSPGGEQALAGPATAWTSDARGEFVFHAPDDAVIEAEHRGRRGRAALDGDVALTRRMVITLGTAAAADGFIAGRVVDDGGVALAGVLVRATPVRLKRAGGKPEVRPMSFAVSDAQGGFRIGELDAGDHDVTAVAEERAPVTAAAVASGTDDLRLELPVGAALVGRVVDAAGAPVPAFTLLVFVRAGLVRELVTSRSIVDGGGGFRVRVPDGTYELIATASGWAPSAPTTATPGTEVTLTVAIGATIHGRVVSGATQTPVSYARVMREAAGGGASATPANAGTVTRADGSFELTGIPAGPVSLTLGAGGHHPKIESLHVARDGEVLGPLTFTLTPLVGDEAPALELVGIGVRLSAEGDLLRVDGVVAGGGAEAAGVVAGDRVTAVDGAPVSELGMDGAIARIRGAPGTRVRITLARDGGDLVLDIERRAIRS